MEKLLLSLLLIIIISGCATNSEALSDEMNSNKQEGEKICKYEKVLGTKIPVRFCYTKEELERLEEASKKMFEKEQRTGDRRQTQETLGTLNPG